MHPDTWASLTADRTVKMHVLPLAVVSLPDACFLEFLCFGHTLAVETLVQPYVAYNGRMSAQHTHMRRADGGVARCLASAQVKEKFVKRQAFDELSACFEQRNAICEYARRFFVAAAEKRGSRLL